MNELEKAAPQEETVTPAPEVAKTENECVVESSPALDIEAVADARSQEQCDAEDACAVESSPALDIEAVADEQNDTKTLARKYHAMTKEELLNSLKEIMESGNMEAHKDVAAIKQAYFNIQSKENLEALNAFVEAGNDPTAFSAQPDEIETELKALYAEFKEKRTDYLAAEEKRLEENLALKQAILGNMEAIASDIDNVGAKFQDFQQLQQDFKNIKDVPPTAETEIWKNFQNVVERFYDNLKINKELRDFDFKKNLEAKRILIDEAKGLQSMTDPVAAFRKLQALHDQWRAIGPVAKEIREEIWEQFRDASTVINKRHQDYFEQRKAAELANEEAKTKLCEEAEAIDMSALKTFNEWNAATDRIIDIQKRWREYGFASKKANTALYNRFRKVCDEFFAAKTAYFQQTKEELNSNLEKKTALCEKAEALKELGDVRRATEEVVKLQAEWKKIGSVPRKQSDAIWQRFTEACNFFFNERKRQDKERHRQEVENLEAKRAIIEELKKLPLDGQRQEVMPQIKELQAKWQEIGFVPFKMKDKIFAEYREVCDALYNSYNSREARNRMENFRNRVSEFKSEGKKMDRERDRLLRVCDAKKSELKTIENNMGFFMVKSSAGNSMVKEMENRIRRIRQDITELEAKIAMLDEEA